MKRKCWKDRDAAMNTMKQTTETKSTALNSGAKRATRVGALTVLAVIAAGAASACKQNFNAAGRLKDSGAFTFASPVSASINIAASGWLIIVGGGDGPAWNTSVVSVSLAAPVEAKITAEGDPGFVGPPAANAPATFEFGPTGGTYTAHFSLRATDGSNKSANCMTQVASALNMEVPAASIKCDKDLLARPDQNLPNGNQTPQQLWSQKIADQIVRNGSNGANPITFAIGMIGPEQIPVETRTAWANLEKEVAAILARYSLGGSAFDEVFGAVQRMVEVSNPADVAQALVAGLNARPDATPQPAEKACYCDVSECDDTLCRAPVNQQVTGIRTAAECSAKSGTSEPSANFLTNGTTQYMSCVFK